MGIEFKKAVRTQVKLKLAISGPSGSGKTWGALALAKGLGGRVAVIDTENESAALYADRFEFDHLCMHPPFTVDKFKAAIDAAVAAKYDVLIIDSTSHEWAAEGGILDQKTQIDLRGTKDSKNQFANWAKPSAEHEKFKAALVQSPIHLIATMRSKMEYDISDGKPKKLGLAPVQREGFEYEFSVVFDVAMDHEAIASKDRTRLFDQRHFKLTEQIGKDLRGWLSQGAPAAAAPLPVDVPRPAPVADDEVAPPAPVPIGEVSSFRTEAEWDDESMAHKQATAEHAWKIASFTSGPLDGQFMEAASLADLRMYREKLAKLIDGGRKTMPNLLALAAMDYWIERRKMEAADFTPAEQAASPTPAQP